MAGHRKNYNMLPAVAELKNALQSCMPRVKEGSRSAVFFTGGLDSTVLAALFVREKPVLVFGAVLDRSCREYNARSILVSRRIAGLLGLVFQVVSITRGDYHEGARALVSAGISSQDKDLPAAAFLLRILREQRISGVVSGMGSNELFSCAPQAASKLARLQKSYAEHRLLGLAEKTDFCAPFLEESVMSAVRDLVCSGFRRQEVLGSLLTDYPDIRQLMKKRVPGHSVVPRNFLPARGLV